MSVLVALTWVVGGLGAAIWASRGVVGGIVALVHHTRIPPFVGGLVLLALGTDLPEIANSVASALEGHGDINVGDSIGSAVTQSTLILGLLPLVGGAFLIARRTVLVVGGATVGALGLGALLMADGHLGRGDALALLAWWVAAAYLAWRTEPAAPAEPVPDGTERLPRAMVRVLLGLAIVGAGAAVAVAGFVRLAGSMGLPEYVVSFFLASIGTSLPELVVDATALRHRQRELAVGGLLGASLLDTTASLGSGPLLAPTPITADLAVRGSILALLAVAGVTALLAVRRRHDRRSGLLLIACYLAFFPLVLGG